MDNHSIQSTEVFGLLAVWVNPHTQRMLMTKSWNLRIVPNLGQRIRTQVGLQLQSSCIPLRGDRRRRNLGIAWKCFLGVSWNALLWCTVMTVIIVVISRYWTIWEAWWLAAIEYSIIRSSSLHLLCEISDSIHFLMVMSNLLSHALKLLCWSYKSCKWDYSKAIGKKMRSLRMTEKALAKPDQLVWSS